MNKKDIINKLDPDIARCGWCGAYIPKKDIVRSTIDCTLFLCKDGRQCIANVTERITKNGQRDTHK